MRVEIDETGCDDLPNCIELDAADETLLGNGGNSATADADVAHRFQSGLGIDDPAAKNHYVEGFRGDRNGRTLLASRQHEPAKCECGHGEEKRKLARY